MLYRFLSDYSEAAAVSQGADRAMTKEEDFAA
jgi:hypothetical protein